MTTDLMLAVLAQLGTIVAAVWSLTEVLGRAFGWRKDLLSLVVGPAMAVVGYAVGFVTAIPGTGWQGWVGAGFGGLVATLVAKQMHDLIAAPLMDRLRGSGPGGGTPADGGGT